ncbi:RNA polymerase sigma factor [Paenibacillus alvei]|nr:RNA polymerase, sigma-24 subunit, ECF subfamily protein [Paenibacillus alvei DSM 29]MBG9733386.1 DNA-directed RNA polymerase subunit sigma [Paenibacillus alvei]MBG9742759.1 DNA-directed RNA polymerase subunit sigma [Paenibacillus alvei]
MQSDISGERVVKPMNIEEVVAEVQSGDKQAYRVILQHYERQMYTYCYYILKNHAETEDAVQEIFIRAYENLYQYNRRVSFSAWLYKVAYHHLINLKKKKIRWLNLIKQVEKQNEHFEIAFSQHETIVSQLLTYLTAEERHILLLKAVEQYTFEEISEIMGLKSATVRKKYERLRAKLMDRICKKGEKVHGAYAAHGLR